MQTTTEKAQHLSLDAPPAQPHYLREIQPLLWLSRCRSLLMCGGDVRLQRGLLLARRGPVCAATVAPCLCVVVVRRLLTLTGIFSHVVSSYVACSNGAGALGADTHYARAHFTNCSKLRPSRLLLGAIRRSARGLLAAPGLLTLLSTHASPDNAK